MLSNQPDRPFLKRSLGISTGLHLTLLPLLLVAVPASFVGEDVASDDLAVPEHVTISYLHIEHRPPPRVVRLAARSKAPKVQLATAPIVVPRLENQRLATKPLAAVPRRPAVRAIFERVARTLAARLAHHVVAMAPPAPGSPNAGAKAGVASAPLELPAASPSPAPTPTAAPALADAGSAHGIDVPAGGWGQNFERPIVADETALADLKTRYHDVARASVDVDETGHAVSVTLPAGLPQDLRADLERRLMELRYVPAECNGLHCAGTLQLTL